MPGTCAGPRFQRVAGLTLAFSLLLVLLLALAPAGATPAGAAPAAIVITNCSNDNALQTAAAAGGLITFNCGGTHAPATIPLTTALVPANGTTVDGSNGGHTVVLDGQGSTRVAQIATGRAVTLTHLVLTDGAALNGSCVDVLGQAALDSVEIHHCAAGAGNFGGGVYVEADATARLDHANLHDNSAGVSGGGLYNSAPNSSQTTLYVTSSAVAHNTAGTDHGAVGDGGGLWNAGFAVVSDTTFFSNTTTVGYGGGLYNQDYLEVDNSTVNQNSAAKWGGGIRNWTGTNYLNSVTFTGNQAVNGGGVASDGAGSDLQAAIATFQDNQASFYGGGLYHAGDILAIAAAVFRHNSAVMGGAIYLNSSLPAIVDASTLEGNTANDGGAIFNAVAGRALIQNNTLSSNRAYYGAGLENDGTATVTNDTLSGNTALSNGGGVFAVVGSQTWLWNATLAGNTSSLSGRALYLETNAVVTATNTLFAGGTQGGNCGGLSGAKITASEYSLSDDLTCALSGTVHLQDPNGQVLHLSGLGHYGGPTQVHMPEHDSPALDGVGGFNAPNVDQRGQPRPVDAGHGNGYDIGAVERQPGDHDTTPWLWLSLLRR